MKRILVMLAVLILLVGCSNEPDNKVDADEVEQGETAGDETEVEELFNRDHDIMLVENDDLEIRLLSSKHERSKDMDMVNLEIEIINKKDKTFEYGFRKLSLDSHRDVGIGMSVHEIKPNDTIQIDVVGIDTSHLDFEEYISGEFHYNDYTSDIPTDKETFSEYIN